jgi:hypothetical protein
LPVSERRLPTADRKIFCSSSLLALIVVDCMTAFQFLPETDSNLGADWEQVASADHLPHPFD